MNAFKPAIAASLAALLLLAGCGKESSGGSSSSATAQPAAQPVSTEAIEKEGQGFTIGSPMSVRTVYVFFDAQCPHCAALWQAAKPLKSQAKFVWLPVRLLNDSSESQGATILAAKDPAAVMDEHEALLMAKKGGISAGGDITAQRAMVKKNTELFKQFQLASVPTIIGKHAQSGALVVKEGGAPTAELAAFLGLNAPSQ
jgi:thiol:disulfide interchange protein DsbG